MQRAGVIQSKASATTGVGGERI